MLFAGPFVCLFVDFCVCLGGKHRSGPGCSRTEYNLLLHAYSYHTVFMRNLKGVPCVTVCSDLHTSRAFTGGFMTEAGAVPAMWMWHAAALLNHFPDKVWRPISSISTAPLSYIRTSLKSSIAHTTMSYHTPYKKTNFVNRSMWQLSNRHNYCQSTQERCSLTPEVCLRSGTCAWHYTCQYLDL